MPALLLVTAYMTLPHIESLKPSLQEFLVFAPYGILVLAMLLSLHFNRSRVFYVLLMLGLAYGSFRYFLQDGRNDFAGQAVFSMLCFLLPLNIMIFYFLKERGVMTLHGKVRLGFILLQVALTGWVVKTEQVEINRFISQAFLPWQILDLVPVSQLALLMMGLSFVLIAVSVLINQSPIGSGFLGALVAVIIVYNFVEIENIFLVFISTAGLILTISVLQDSYNRVCRDGLTGLPARRALDEKMMLLGRRYTIAMIDVDHFKKFNDTYGHNVGDQVLQMVGSNMQKVTGRGKPYRYGGEEFTVVFPGKNMKRVIPHLEELRETIADYQLAIRGKDRPNQARQGKRQRVGKNANKKVSITVSVGVAERNDLFRTPGDVLKAADKALYRAKKKGRNCLST